MTDRADREFERIVVAFTAADSNVTLGRMMSAPGLKFGDKVFAFLAKEGMGFRLGRDFDPADYSDTELEPLNPFKTKGPLKGWFTIRPEQSGQWEEFARRALTFTRTL